MFEVFIDIWIPKTDTPCGQDPEMWVNSRVYNHDKSLKKLAIKACNESCEERLDCLTDALRIEKGVHRDKRYGIRGGMTPMERYNLDRQYNTNFKKEIAND